MAQYRICDFFDIFRCDKGSSFDESADPACKNEENACTRACSDIDELCDSLFFRLSRLRNYRNDIFFDPVVGIDLFCDLLPLLYFSFIQNFVEFLRELASFEFLNYFKFFVRCRIVYQHFEHESVDLCFWKRIRSFLFKRVLCRKNDERVGEFKSVAADRDLTLLHRFKKRRLNFCRCTVYFVGKDDIRENDTFFRLKTVLRHVEDPASDYISGKQVGSKLYSLEIKVGRVCKSFYRSRFCKSGNAFEQNVPFADHSHDERFDHLFLADYNF